MSRRNRLPLRMAIAVVLTPLGMSPAWAITLDATFTGSTGGSWCAASNWDIGVVPNNTGPVTFNVVIPIGTTVQQDCATPIVIDALTLNDDATLNLLSGSDLEVLKDAQIAGIIDATAAIFTAVGPVSLGSNGIIRPVSGSTVELLGAAQIAGLVDANGSSVSGFAEASGFSGNRARVYARDGAIVTIGGTTYTTTGLGAETLLLADGGTAQLRTELNLGSITDLNAGFSVGGGAFIQSIQAINGGHIDLSGLKTVTGPAAASGEDEQLRFVVDTGGTINLDSLQTVTASPYGDVRFYAQGGQTIQLPALQSVKSTLFFAEGGGKIIADGPTGFTYDSSSVYLHYPLLMSADGAGSELKLPAMVSLTHNSSWGGVACAHTIQAINGGHIDLSGLKTVTGPAAASGEDEQLRFVVDTGGTINLDSLQTVTASPYGDVRFYAQGGQTIQLPALQSVKSTLFFAEGGGKIIADGPTGFTYDSSSVYLHYPLLMSADGAGSELKLPAMVSLTHNSSWGGVACAHTIQAINGGHIDLSGLFTIGGPSEDERLNLTVDKGGTINLSGWSLVQNASSDASVNLSVSAASSATLGRLRYQGNGTITLNDATLTAGALSATHPLTVTLNNAADRLEVFDSLRLGSQISLSAAQGSTITVGRDLTHAHTDVNKAKFGGSTLRLDGSGIQRFEVGGVDVYTFPQLLSNDNFGVGRLVVGRADQATLVDLRDDIDNGKRAGLPNEAFYIFGPQGRTGTPQVGDPDGLEILGGSTVIIHNLSVYARQASGWVSLQEQLPVGQRRAAFGGGFIARTLSDVAGAWEGTGGGEWSSEANWFVAKPAAAGSMAVFGDKAAGPATINVDAPVTVGLLAFDNANAYTLAGAHAISLSDAAGRRATIRVERDNGAGAHVIAAPLTILAPLDLINNSTAPFTLSGAVSTPVARTIHKMGTGTVILSGPQSHAAGTTLRIEEGTLQASGNLAGPGNAPLVNIFSTGGVTLLEGNRRLKDLTIIGGAVKLAEGGGRVMNVETLWMDGSGQLDLAGHDMVIHQGQAPQVRAALKRGFNDGAWNGPGMLTSIHSPRPDLGYASATDPLIAHLGGMLYGQPFAADGVVVKMTLAGDANLDGDVDLDDVNRWISNFTGQLSLAPADPFGKLWTDGDWDYDGDVDLDDVNKWLANFTGQLGGGLWVDVPGASPEAIEAARSIGITVVPEPGAISMLGLAAGLLARRRRLPCHA